MPVRIKIIRSEKPEQRSNKPVEEKKTVDEKPVEEKKTINDNPKSITEEKPINLTEEKPRTSPMVSLKHQYPPTNQAVRPRNINSQILANAKTADSRRRNPILGIRI